MDIYFDRIKPLFDQSGIPDAELERNIGIPPKKINQWNAKYTKSYQKYIPQIASYFHVSTDYLLGNTDDPSPAGQKEKPPAESGEPVGPNKKAVLDLVQAMSEEEAGPVLEAVKAMMKMRGTK